MTNYKIDQSLDTIDNQLDALVANPVAGSPARWVPDLIGILHLFVTSAIPGYSFSDTLNAWGDFLNRVVPPFTIDSAASTFGIITPYKIMAAAVAGTATVFTDMLNGTYDPAQIEIDVIKTTTGATVTRSDLSDSTSLDTKIAASVALGGGVYSSPAEAWNTVLPTWTAAQVNPFTIVTYVVLVALYKRFQEMAALQTFTVGTQYNSGTPYTLGLTPETASEYANGSFSAVDENGNSVSFAPADGNTYTSAWGGLVTINTYGGGYTYTNTLPGVAFFAAGAAGQSDTVSIPVTSVDGAPYTLTFQIKILTVANTPSPGDSTFTTSTTYNSGYPSTIDLGSVGTRSEYAYGTFHAVDQNGVAASFSPASGNTYTSAWGALVTINSATGGFSYTQTTPGAAYFHAGTSANPYDTVQVTVQGADGKNYLVTEKIQIVGGVNSAPTVSSTVGSADTLGVVRGTVNGSDSDGDTLTYSLVGSSVNGLSGNSAYTKNGANNGGIVTLNSTTGAFTYASTSTAGASQSFQVQVADGHGGNTVTTVTVPNTSSITPSNVNTSTPNVVTGSVPAPTADTGMFTYSLGTAPTKGTVTFNSTTGAFTYTRNSGLGHTGGLADSFTVIATDANGRAVTLTVPVTPTVTNTAPTLTLTNAPTVGSLSGSTNDTGSATSTQTSTGKFTATDADGDTLTYSATTGSQGGTLTFNSDGSFTYTGTLSNTVRHAAAKIGATSAGMNDTFTVTVSDGYGGTANYTLSVPIYAINSAPVITGFGGITCAFYACTVGTMTISDPDGDSIPNTKITAGTGAGYTLATGSVTVWGSGTTTISWSAGGTFGTTATANTFTVYDGYYTVTNGVVNVGTPSKFWAQWAAGSGTRTTGN
ncbi:beta strand repeat-containing protein [Mycolicibacterium helvum]|uniref:beta strand repeat-containing protein n=1 Tax=Mycolicibacterium helvum TaxID=1534349 RepID=UPI0013D465A6|nr:Ig-like domain-containing protein [Mycolicibacterium helvum]